MKFRRKSGISGRKSAQEPYPVNGSESTASETTAVVQEDLADAKSESQYGTHLTSRSSFSLISKRRSRRRPPRKFKAELRESYCALVLSASTMSDASITDVAEHDNVVQVEKGKTELHYFWGSSVALKIYSVCLASLLLQQLWILHGITLILLGCMLERAFAWGLFFYENKDFQKLKRLVFWVLKFTLGELDKTVQGDVMRGWVAGFSLQFWNSRGKDYFLYLWRNQLNNTNSAVLKERKDLIERSNQIHQEMIRRRKILSQRLLNARQRSGNLFRSS